jgi:pyruvate kinase
MGIFAERGKRRRPRWRSAHLGFIESEEARRAITAMAESRQPTAIMIARGDLAAEIGFVRTAEMQEEILWIGEAAHVPVIWTTQVLESLVKKGVKVRGEMTDAAVAARAECVMLNKGPYALEAVAQLDRLLTRMGENQQKKTPLLRRLASW